MKKRMIAGITAAMILSVAVLLSGCGSTGSTLQQTAANQSVSTGTAAELTALEDIIIPT